MLDVLEIKIRVRSKYFVLKYEEENAHDDVSSRELVSKLFHSMKQTEDNACNGNPFILANFLHWLDFPN